MRRGKWKNVLQDMFVVSFDQHHPSNHYISSHGCPSRSHTDFDADTETAYLRNRIPFPMYCIALSSSQSPASKCKAGEATEK